MIGRLSWLGGRTTAKDEAASRARAHRHRKHATKTDRRGWADHDTRDRRLYGD